MYTPSKESAENLKALQQKLDIELEIVKKQLNVTTDPTLHTLREDNLKTIDKLFNKMVDENDR